MVGINDMGPEVIVLIGDFISAEKRSEGFSKFKETMEFLLQVIKEKQLTFLQEQTQWILIPSLNDAAMCKLMPTFKLADYLVSSIRGPKRIANVMLGTNPMRLSFRGKEIVICRYNYFKKIKKNHIQRIAEKQPICTQPDSFKIAKTVLQ